MDRNKEFLIDIMHIQHKKLKDLLSIRFRETMNILHRRPGMLTE